MSSSLPAGFGHFDLFDDATFGDAEIDSLLRGFTAFHSHPIEVEKGLVVRELRIMGEVEAQRKERRRALREAERQRLEVEENNAAMDRNSQRNKETARQQHTAHHSTHTHSPSQHRIRTLIDSCRASSAWSAAASLCSVREAASLRARDRPGSAGGKRQDAGRIAQSYDTQHTARLSAHYGLLVITVVSISCSLTLTLSLPHWLTPLCSCHSGGCDQQVVLLAEQQLHQSSALQG